jgi:hypothetical protein
MVTVREVGKTRMVTVSGMVTVSEGMVPLSTDVTLRDNFRVPPPFRMRPGIS